MNTLTQQELKDLLNYDPDTGLFEWISRRGGTRSDLHAGYRHGTGYLAIKVKGKCYKAHRLAWLYVYGKWPDHEIDHINGKRDDNRISNLRDVRKGENQQNQRAKEGKYPGVSWHKRDKCWVAAIKHNKVRTHLGYFDDPKKAFEAYLLAKKVFHATANLNQYPSIE
jgi:hypothetical protein